MKRFLLFVLCGWCSCFPTYADVLVPLDLFADKNQGKASEGVFVWNGDKYLCEAPVTLFFETEKEAKELCGLCPNRKIERMAGGKSIKLYGAVYSSVERKHKKKKNWYGGDKYDDVYACVPKSIRECPVDKPLLDTYGFCHTCNEEKRIDVSWGKSVANKPFVCTDRKFTKGEKYSILTNCPQEKPFRDVYGNCYGCDEGSAVIVEKGHNDLVEQAEKNNCPNREDVSSDDFFGYYTIYNVLKKCPTSLPLKDEKGGCHTSNEKN